MVTVRKIKKKMNKSVEKPDDIYLLLDSFSLKSGLINTEFEFFKDYIIDIENYFLVDFF